MPSCVVNQSEKSGSFGQTDRMFSTGVRLAMESLVMESLKVQLVLKESISWQVDRSTTPKNRSEP
jgi:hypothetical protein